VLQRTVYACQVQSTLGLYRDSSSGEGERDVHMF
jgi:hypothetical protein